MAMTMKRATFRHVEAEIYAYYDTKKAIDEIRQQMMSDGRQEAVGAVVGDRYAGTSVVERLATRLADSVLLREMERITRAIENVYASAKEECRRIIWVKYGLALEGWQPPTDLEEKMRGRNRFDISHDEMADILAVNRATFYRYRQGFVYGVAQKLGWY